MRRPNLTSHRRCWDGYAGLRFGASLALWNKIVDFTVRSDGLVESVLHRLYLALQQSLGVEDQATQLLPRGFVGLTADVGDAFECIGLRPIAGIRGMPSRSVCFAVGGEQRAA